MSKKPRNNTCAATALIGTSLCLDQSMTDWFLATYIRKQFNIDTFPRIQITRNFFDDYSEILKRKGCCKPNTFFSHTRTSLVPQKSYFVFNLYPLNNKDHFITIDQLQFKVSLFLVVLKKKK